MSSQVGKDIQLVCISMYCGLYCGMYWYVLAWYVLWYVLICINFGMYCKYWFVLVCTDIQSVQVLACIDMYLDVLCIWYILHMLIGISLY